jgi:hypothetical protein
MKLVDQKRKLRDKPAATPDNRPQPFVHMDVMKPSATLIAKLGSIVVHMDEATDFLGHHFDVIAMRQLVADPEVQSWLYGLRLHAMVPVKRS